MTKVDVVPYDPAWPGMAAGAVALLRLVLGGSVAAIEHIGSTAVPGLAAKPTIDLMAATDRLDRVGGHADVLEPLRYHRHVNAMADRLLFVRWVDRVRSHILHVVTLDTWPTRNQRILRDHLREHPEEADRYGRLKLELAAAGVHSRDHARAKAALLQELTDRARAARGLP
ncbi:hypothetical protein Ait01nite_023300 [Actinoplanes italicus]|uniref:GrpB-like predicted nucleotidyltransferase (UPF0157 family) n=1 Tax=Actinoplanes italicus TaxID=113567 RepID=A0A2T0KFY7_9ACTN|nr:GrpB family protein [Actinoplanes italicus]PRX22293.1 GrpB-like predicted nucleotidyltransferase (UPF0157 family) [Actinoplanes italicus]GIE29285.1 hypothetical protein Ait01nite_023300 [Actinoplanes italicus]